MGCLPKLPFDVTKPKTSRNIWSCTYLEAFATTVHCVLTVYNKTTGSSIPAHVFMRLFRGPFA